MYCSNCLQRLDIDADRCPACAGDPLLDGRYRLDRELRSTRTAHSYRATRTDDALLVRACVLESGGASLDASVLDIDHPRLARIVALVREPARVWLIQATTRALTLAELAETEREAWREGVALLELIAAVADGLAHLHARGLSHAALSGETILVARDADDGGEGANRGSRVTLVDPRFDAATHPAADVYALGLTLTRLLVGDASDSLAPPVGWREQLSDGALVALLDRMLAPNREQRISSETLREAAGGLLRVRSMGREARSEDLRSPPTRPRASKPTPRFMMIDPPQPSPRADSSKQVRGRVNKFKSSGDADIPVMRPDELSRELSQAHRACAAVEQRKRQQASLARVLLVLVAATITALTTYIVMHSL